jgi:hypothetical protein
LRSGTVSLSELDFYQKEEGKEDHNGDKESG